MWSLSHIHNKRKDSLETPDKHGRNQLFAGGLHAALDKAKADMLQIRKYKEMELEMDHLISRWYYKKIVDTNSSSPPKYSLVANRRGGRGGRRVGIRMSWVEKFRKINQRGDVYSDLRVYKPDKSQQIQIIRNFVGNDKSIKDPNESYKKFIAIFTSAKIYSTHENKTLPITA